MVIRLLDVAPVPDSISRRVQDPDFVYAERTLGIGWRHFARPKVGGLEVWRVELNLDGDSRAKATAIIKATDDPAGRSSDQLALRGLALAALDRHEEAAAIFAELSRMRHGCAEAHLMSGVCLAELSRWAEAEEAFRRAKRLAPTMAEAHWLLALALNWRREGDGAMAASREAVRLARHDHRAWIGLAAVLARFAPGWREALDAARHSMTLAPGDVDAAGTFAYVCARRLTHLGEAELAMTDLVARHPSDPYVWRMLGLVLGQLRKYDQAESAFREGLKIDPNNPEALFGLAWLQGDKLGHYAESVVTSRRLVRAWPSCALAWFKLASCAKKLEDWPTASEAYREATRLWPWDPDGWANLAFVLWHAGHYEEAETAYRENVRRRPADPWAWSGLAYALCKKQRWPETELAARRALMLSNRRRAADARADAFSYLAFALYHQNRWADAGQAFVAAAKLRPGDVEHVRELAWWLAECGEITAAEANYRKALAIAPGEPDAWSGLVGLLEDAGRWAEVETMCRERLALHPEEHSPWCDLATVLLKQGKSASEAEAIARSALKLRPKCSWAHARLGEALWHQGRPDAAEPLLRRAVELRKDNRAAWDVLGRFLEAQGRVDEGRKAQDQANQMKREEEGRRAAIAQSLKHQPPPAHRNDSTSR